MKKKATPSIDRAAPRPLAIDAEFLEDRKIFAALALLGMIINGAAAEAPRIDDVIDKAFALGEKAAHRARDRNP